MHLRFRCYWTPYLENISVNFVITDLYKFQ